MKVVISGGFILVFGLLYRCEVPTMKQDGRSSGSAAAAIELSLGDADTAKLRSMAQSRTEQASRVEPGADIAGLSGSPLVLCSRPGAFWTASSDGLSAASQRAVAEGPAFAAPSTIALDPVESRQSLSRPRRMAGVVEACRKAKELGYPHELWTTRLLPATPASMDRRRDMCASPTWVQGTVQDPRPGGGEAAQSGVLPGTARSRLCGEDG